MSVEFTKNSDYSLQKLELTNFAGNKLSIVDDFVELKFTESIYENFISGTVSIQDSYDLAQYFPLIGEEKLELSFTTDGEETIRKKFHVYRSYSERKENTLIHVLFFVSEEAMNDQNNTVSKSYLKKQSHVIVQDLYSVIKTDKKLNFEETKGLHHVVIPNWSPLQAINWVCSFSQHEGYIGGTFLFYENKDGFNFNPIEKLIDTPSKRLYTSVIQNRVEENNRGRSIKEFRQLSGTSDTLVSMSEGMYANSVIAYDNISRSYKKYSYDYESDFTKTKHLNEFRLNSDQFEYKNKNQRISLIPSTSNRNDSAYVKSKSGDSVSLNIEETSYYKTSILSQLSSRQFEITFYGDSTLTAGDVVDIELQNVSQLDTKRNEPHRFDRKRFLLSTCTHVLSRTKYIIISRAVSDTLINTPSYEL